MNAAKLLAVVLVVLVFPVLAGPADGIMMRVRAVTTDGWSCNNIGTAPMSFTWTVTITNASTAWRGELIDWGAFAYDDCNLGLNGLLGGRSNAFEIFGSTAGVQGAIHYALPCPAQGRTLAIATNRGYGPGILSGEDTSFCPVPCAPILCRPDACDTVH